MRFARDLRAALGRPLRVTHSPLIVPVLLHPTLPTAEYRAVIFTSETGVMASGMIDHLPKLAFCVGDQTARAARRAGFVTQSAAGDADALVRLILQAAPRYPLLHVCGLDTRGDVADRLTSAGIETHIAIAYRQNAIPLTPAACRLLSGKNAIIAPLFSPRTAQIFAASAEPIARAPVCIAAFSVAVAQALGGLKIAGLEIAAQPTADGMIAAVRRLADKFPVA
jgi:uroporphyrinogen-III synthase